MSGGSPLWRTLAEHAARTPDKRAIAAPDGAYSYAQMLRGAHAVGDFLLENHALAQGDRIAYLGFNSAIQLILTIAASRAGLIVSPLNWRLAEDELGWILDHGDPAIIIADPHHAETARRIAGQRPVLETTRIADLTHDDHPDAKVPDAKVPDVLPPNVLLPEGVTGESPLLLVYTSGATGRPKGAVLTQDAVLANARLSQDMHAMTPADHVLTALPMFHVGGLNIQTMPALLCGATVTLMDRFEPGACLRLIRDARPSLTVQVPATLNALLAHPDWSGTDLGCLRAIATGSTDVPVPLIRKVHDAGPPVIQIYGATETGPVVVYQKIDDAQSHLGSIGRAGPGVSVSIRDPEGSVCAPDQPGEIWLRAPTLATGYWQDPANPAFADGWFRTGDVARQDPDGYLWFTDRVKNVIISGGENIYPAELERILAAVPGIAEAAVVGLPDPRWGTVPVAAVVRKDANTTAATSAAEISTAEISTTEISAAEILAAFDGRLARFKHPKAVHFVDALPRNAMGKIVPDQVRDMLTARSASP